MLFLEYVASAIFILLLCIHLVWIFVLLGKKDKKYKKFSPWVSVVIPAHNEEKIIEKTIQSVFDDGYDKIKEIIVINDGSTDNTQKVLEKIKDMRVKIYQTNHVGKANAVNFGVKKSSSEFLLILDADSLLKKGTIAELLAPFEDEKVGGTTGVIRGIKTKNPLTWFQDYEYIFSSSWRYLTTKLDGNSILPGIACIRKDAFVKTGSFSDDTLTEDFDLGIGMRKIGYKTVMIKTAVIHTRLPNNVKSLIRQRLRWSLGSLQVMKKNFKFIFSRRSGAVGYFSVPTQFYWYIHAAVYMPIAIFLMLYGYNQYFLSSNVVVSLDVVKFFISWLTVYGIFDLIYNVFITHTYAMSLMIITVIIMYFVSLIYTILVFIKVSRPDIRALLVHIIIFPYSVLTLSPLVVSLFRFYFSKKRNVWTK